MNKIDISDFITSIENTFMDNGMMFEVECVTPEEVEDDVRYNDTFTVSCGWNIMLSSCSQHTNPIRTYRTNNVPSIRSSTDLKLYLRLPIPVFDYSTK